MATIIYSKLRDEDDLLRAGSFEAEDVLCEGAESAAAFLAYALV